MAKYPAGFTPLNIGSQTGAPSVTFTKYEKPEVRPQIGQGAAGEFAGNTVRAVASPLVRTGGLIEKALDQTIGRVGNAIAGKGFVPTHTGQDAENSAEAIDAGAADTTAGHVGTIVGTIAPYFTGVGEAAVAERVAAVIPKLAETLGVDAESLMPKIIGYLAKNAPEVAKDTAIGTAQTGDFSEGALAGIGAPVTKGVLGLLGKVTGKIVKGPELDNFVRDFVTPQQTKGKGGIYAKNVKAGRVEEAKGLTGKRTVNPDSHQIDMENEIKTVPGINTKGTLLDNANAIHDEIGSTAESLSTQLKDANVVVDRTALDSTMKSAIDEIGENPVLVGDAGESAVRIIDKFRSFLPKEGNITAHDILVARKSLDQWMKSIKGAQVLDPKTESAVSIALRSVRQGANQLIADSATDIPVKNLLRRQSLLYDALENVAPKVGKEGETLLQQFGNKHPLLKKYGGYGAAIVGGGTILPPIYHYLLGD